MAPGWLDGDVKLLKPESEASASGHDTFMAEGNVQSRPQQQRRTSVGIKGLIERRDGPQNSREGDEIDRAFGGLRIK